jgi:hypothetical protein
VHDIHLYIEAWRYELWPTVKPPLRTVQAPVAKKKAVGGIGAASMKRSAEREVRDRERVAGWKSERANERTSKRAKE